MAEELLDKITSKKLAEKVPAEKCWAITAQALTKLIASRVHLTRPQFGRGEGIVAPVTGWEKYQEIQEKIFSEGGMKFISWVKETFNIPVEDAIGADNLSTVTGALQNGPDREYIHIERTPERVVGRYLKCPWWEIYKDYGVKPEFTICEPVCAEIFEEGIQIINPKITYKITKSMPRGDPYCEFLTEFRKNNHLDRLR